MKKFLSRFLFGILSLSIILSVLSCADEDNGGGEPASAEVSISASQTAIELAPGASKTISVNTNGTMLAPSSSDSNVATAVISNSDKTVTITASSNVTEISNAVITVPLNDSSNTLRIEVTVDPDSENTGDTMSLVFNFEESLAASSISLVYWPADGDSADGETKEATVTNNSATVTLSGDYKNDSGWINAALTVKNSSDEDISENVGLSFSDTDWGGDVAKFWGEFEIDGVITVTCSDTSTAEEKYMTLKLAFDKAIGASSAKIQYYSANVNISDLTDETGKTETVTVSENCATVSLSDKYASTWGYNAIITVYDSSSNDITESADEITVSGGGGSEKATYNEETVRKFWFAFTADGEVTISFIKEDTTVTYSFPYTSDTITVESAETYTKILPASAFSELTIKQLIVTVSSETADAWASLSAASTWTEGLYWSDCINVEKTITDETFIAGVLENGLYIQTSAGDFVVTVNYSEEEASSDDTSSDTGTTDYSYTAIVESQNFTASDDYVQVLESSEFADLSISALKVVVTLSSTGDNGWWAGASSASGWASGTYQSLAWSDSDSGYSAEITSEDFITALATNGLYLNVDSSAVGAVSVYYATASE